MNRKQTMKTWWRAAGLPARIGALGVALMAGSATTALAVPMLRTVVWSSVFEAPLAKWRYVDVTSGGVLRVNGRFPDSAGGSGSMEQKLPDQPYASARTEVLSFDVYPDPVLGLYPEAGGFGLLSQLDELSFEWLRDSQSTVWGHITPSFRIIVWDPDVGYFGGTYALVWEGVYNGYAINPGFSVPTDRWVHSDMTSDTFWRAPIYIDGDWVGPRYCANNRSECYVYNRGLHDWGLGPSTVVVGLSVSVGSGWTGDYRGAIDYVTLGFTNGSRSVWDFEPTPQSK